MLCYHRGLLVFEPIPPLTRHEFYPLFTLCHAAALNKPLVGVYYMVRPYSSLNHPNKLTLNSSKREHRHRPSLLPPTPQRPRFSHSLYWVGTPSSFLRPWSGPKSSSTESRSPRFRCPLSCLCKWPCKSRSSQFSCPLSHLCKCLCGSLSPRFRCPPFSSVEMPL